MADIEKLKRLARKGVLAREIAAELGISRQRVYQICNKLEIKLRPYDAAMREPRPLKPRKIQPRIITGGVMHPVNTIVAGTIAELLAAADLMARGWQIYRPILNTRGVDIVAIKDGKMITVEVRSAYRKENGALKFREDVIARADHYALVVTGEPTSYVPELPDTTINPNN